MGLSPAVGEFCVKTRRRQWLGCGWGAAGVGSAQEVQNNLRGRFGGFFRDEVAGGKGD